jgi:hypothetical protein
MSPVDFFSPTWWVSEVICHNPIVMNPPRLNKSVFFYIRG